ncbi:hypothetical protein DL765_009017 [Monosporascus sp. GIB2]|nr:hypothetical protein DL765_009017 [Monosporascus sp. GIB2]
MQFTVARSLICAIGLPPVMTSPVERPSDLLTIDLPPGYGVNGTIVMDMKKFAQYLQDEVGVGMDIDMDKLAKISPVLQENNKYRFPEGSGLERSSVSYSPNQVEHSTQVVPNYKCRKCAACVVLLIFYPAYIACSASPAAS